MKGCSIFWVIVRKKVAPVHGRQKCRGAWKIFVGAVRLSKSVSLYCGTPNKKPRALDRGQCAMGRGSCTKNQKPRPKVHGFTGRGRVARIRGSRVADLGPTARVRRSLATFHGARPSGRPYVQRERAEATRAKFNLFNPSVTGLSHTFPSRILFWLLMVDRLL